MINCVLYFYNTNKLLHILFFHNMSINIYIIVSHLNALILIYLNLSKFKEKGCNHDVTITMFSRSFYEAKSIGLKNNNIHLK